MKKAYFKVKEKFKKTFARKSSSRLMRIALFMAMLSVFFERLPEAIESFLRIEHHQTALIMGLGGLAFLSLNKKYHRLSVGLFCLIMGFLTFSNWATAANHTWLAVWTIPIAVFFSTWWKEDMYIKYLRYTMGIVMIGAGLQKIVSGNYFDGSMITYLSHYGSQTEMLFKNLCIGDLEKAPCFYHQAIGTFIVLWQFLVGIFILIGSRNSLILFTEIAFLMGAGIYADELNFQVLNIALLCIIFRFGMPAWLFVICIAMLITDIFGLSFIINKLFF